MKKRKIKVFVLGAVVLTLALFGCSSGNVSNTTAPGAAVDGAALYTSDCSGCHGPLAASGKKGTTVAQIQDAIAHNWGGMGAFAGLTTDQLQAIATALAPVTTTNTPATTASLDGVALYADNCSSCHGSLATSGKGGAMASTIQAAIAGNYGGMGRFSNLTTAQLQAIADALATVQTPASVQTPPPGSSLDGAALYAQYCQGCHQPLASSTKKGRTAAQIQAGISGVGAMRSLSNLTAAQIEAIAAALGTGSSSTPSPLPAPATTDGAALYAQYCEGCHQPLASSTKAGRTATQIQTAIGSVGNMSSLSNLSATQIQAIASALGTMSAPAPTDGAGFYASYCSSCHGALSSSQVRGSSASTIQSALSGVSQMRSISLTSTQIQAIATALGTTGSTSGGTTSSTDGAALYTTYCSSCHGSLAASAKAGRTAAQITTAITSVGVMNSLSNLTATQIQAIASALATAPVPAPTDGAGLYTSYCSSCHGALSSSQVRGSSASTITSALSGVSQMRSISLTSTQIQAIATALGTTASSGGSTTTPTPTTTDGATLYGTYCASCHGPLASSTKGGRTAAQITAAITSVGVMNSLSSLTATQVQAIASALAPVAPAPTPACGSCHAIPPATGHHTYHVTSQRVSCGTCHGTGYSSTTVNTATHNNGVVNIASTPGWNPTTRSCSNSCHGTKRW